MALSRAERYSRLCDRRRLAAALPGAALFLLAAGTNVYTAAVVRDDSPPTPPPNRPPTVLASCDPCEVFPGGDVRLKATASDPDGDGLTYRWRAQEGSFLWLQDGGTRVELRTTIRWQAPPVAGRYQVTVVVSDGRGATESSTVEINVNSPPTVSLSCVDRCRVRQGLSVRLEATASDPDGHELSYSWSAESGSFIGQTDTATARWQAPAVVGPMAIRVTISDAQEGSASDEVDVTVDPLSNQSAVFASYLVSIPSEDPDQVVDTYLTVGNVLSAPEGVETAGGPYEGDDKVGTLEIHLYGRDDDEPMVHKTTGDSPGDGLDENGRLAPGQTYTVHLAELIGEDRAFVGYGWIVGNFDGIAGTRTIVNSGLGMTWHGDLTPKLSRHGAGVKPIPAPAHESNVVVADGRDWGDDPYRVNSAAIDGDRLTISVSFSGGCRRHDFTLVVSPTFRESDPVQLPAVLAHDANGDTCEAYPTESHVFDLTPVRTRYRQFYGPGPGRIILRITGVAGDDLVYEFDG